MQPIPIRSRRRYAPSVIELAVAAAFLLVAAPARAQEQPAPPSAQQQNSPPSSGANQGSSAQPQKTPDKTDQSNGNPQVENGTSNDRLFWTLPDFLTIESEGKIPPLTTGQKFRVVTRESFDISVYPYVVFVAAVSQADNSERGYGQGWGAYGKRVASAFADTEIENYMTGAVFPSLLHEDPRYYQMGKGGFWRRFGYSASRIAITRTDSGHDRFNFSEFVGAGVSAGISDLYHPSTDRNLTNTASEWASQIAWDTFTLELKEFWPDVRRKLSKHKNTNP